MLFIFVIAYLQKRAGACTGMAPQTELRGHSCPQGQGRGGDRGAEVSLSHPKAQEGGDTAGTPLCIQPGSLRALEQTISSQEMKEELP